MEDKKVVKIDLKIFIIIISLVTILIIGYVIYNNQKNFKCVYGYCPNNSYIYIEDVIVRDRTELKERLISQLENAKENLISEKQRDPDAYENIIIKDNIIYVNENWKLENKEWNRNNEDLKVNKTIEEYFNDEFFETHNIIAFSYSLCNDMRIVKSIRYQEEKAYVKFNYKRVYGGPYDNSVGYCFIILDKNIENYEIIN